MEFIYSISITINLLCADVRPIPPGRSSRQINWNGAGGEREREDSRGAMVFINLFRNQRFGRRRRVSAALCPSERAASPNP